MLVCALVAAAAVLFETVTPTSVERVQAAAACALTATFVVRLQAAAECLATAQPLTEALVPFEVPAADAESVAPPKIVTSACARPSLSEDIPEPTPKFPVQLVLKDLYFIAIYELPVISAHPLALKL